MNHLDRRELALQSLRRIPRQDQGPPRPRRLLSGLLLTGCLALMGVAAWLSPDERGYGTHTALDLPPCSLLEATGYPCMTCGMTTSFSHAAEGSLVTSFITQPAGASLALLTAIGSVICGWAVVVGMPLAPLGARLLRPWLIWCFGGWLVAAWGYKIVAVQQGW